MRFTSRHLLALVTLLGMPLIGVQDSAGFSYFVADGVKVVWNGAQSLRYLSPTTFPPGSVAELHVLEAMGLWTIVPAADFQYSYLTADQDYPIDNFDGFSDTAAVPASQLDPGVLGVTFLVNNGSEWYDMDVLFSDSAAGGGYTFDPNPDCQVVANPTPTYGYSFLLIAVHELGHALGLGHDPIGNEPAGSSWFVATMNPRYPSGGPIGQENIIELHTDDRRGVRFLYPHAGPSGSPAPDLASAGYATSSVPGQAIPLFFDPSTALPGEEIAARSVIENFGSTNEFYVRQGFYLSDDRWIDTGDQFLGALTWDIPFNEAFEFDAIVPMPDDLPAGIYYLGSILDDLNQIAEVYEDNNAAVYCAPLTVGQLAPAILPLGQQVIPCDAPYRSAPPGVTHPLNMAPITWSLDNAQPGMVIDPDTGEILWDRPVHSPFLYSLTVRATNDAGSATQLFFLGVSPSVPQISPASTGTEFAACGQSYVSGTPSVADPACMEPILSWTLLEGPPDATINVTTGEVSWPEPTPTKTPDRIVVQATNAAGSGVTSWTIPVTIGDADGNGTVNLPEFRAFTSCLSGPATALREGCLCADGNEDGTADLRDLALVQQVFHK